MVQSYLLVRENNKMNHFRAAVKKEIYIACLVVLMSKTFSLSILCLSPLQKHFQKHFAILPKVDIQCVSELYSFLDKYYV